MNFLTKMFSRPIPQVKEKVLPGPDHLPKPPYSHLSEQERFYIFENWMVKQGKVYSTEKEKLYRFDIFKDAMQTIEEGCAASKNNSYCLGLTANCDLTDSEYRKKMGWPQLQTI